MSELADKAVIRLHAENKALREQVGELQLDKQELQAQLADIERELLARNTVLPDIKTISNIISIVNRKTSTQEQDND